MQGLQGTRIALLIDFDNVILGVDDPGFDVELVVNALRSRGVVVLGRAYGDWYRHHRHRRKLMEQGIELVETPVFGPVIKNSADIRIVLDGFEIAMSQSHIDTFCLVSGDSDFLPLIKKLQYLGKTVIVIAGHKFTSDLVRRNCNEYIAYENLFAESLGATEDVGTLEGAFHLLGRAISTLGERGMDVRSSTVKQMMVQLNPAFSERTFGCNQFKQFLDKGARAGIVKLGERDGVSGEYAVLLTTEGEAAVAAIVATTTTAPAADARREAARPVPAPSRNGRRRGRGDRAETPESRPAGATEATFSTDSTTETAPVAPHEYSGATTNGAPAPDEATLEPIGFDADAPVPVPSIPLSARAGLRRGRLRFSAKSGGSVISTRNETPSTTTSTPAQASTESNLSNDATAESPGQEAVLPGLVVDETILVGSPDDLAATPESETEVDAAGEIDASPTVATENGEAIGQGKAGDDATTGAPAKKRAARGGRRRKSTSKTGASGEVGAESSGDSSGSGDASGDSVAPVDVGDATQETRAAHDSVASEPALPLETPTDVSDAGADSPSGGDAEATGEPARKKPARSRRGGARKTAAKPAPPADAT